MEASDSIVVRLLPPVVGSEEKGVKDSSCGPATTSGDVRFPFSA